MGVFTYRAIDLDAAPVAGTILADTPRQARETLRGKGLSVLEIQTAAPARGRWQQGFLARRQSGKLTSLIRELSTLLGVGIPLLEALDTIAKQHRGTFKTVLLDLRDRVSAGASLAQALRAHPEIFDDLCLNLVEVGENAGTLDATLARLADFKERAAQLKGRIATALLYPGIVLTMALGVSLFLMTYVVPQLLTGLTDARRPIPWPTQIVKGASDLLVHRWWLLVLIAGALGVVGGALLRVPAVRLALWKLQLRLPLVGELIRKQAITRIAIVLSTLLKSGIVFEKAVQIAQKSTPNLVLRQALQQCERAVLAGMDIAGALEKTRAFPPTVVQIFLVGEQSGRLEEMLERLAADYDRQVHTATQRLTAVLEPLLIMVLVLVVGLIAFATVLPMLEAGHVLGS